MGIEKLHLEDALEDSPQVNYGRTLVQTDVKVKWEGLCRVQTTGFPHANGTDGIDLQSQFGIPSLESSGMSISVVAFSILCHEFDRVWHGTGYILTEVLYQSAVFNLSS